ncbi:MAG: serine/threonine-protein phosphatase [Acidobacteria bacterium]|nr:serine/threonine-protein phosphatase [Acidobacteriota bacterium]
MILIPGNAQNIGSRQQQQDAFGFSDLSDAVFRKHGGVLAVVADGMGGMAHGDAASREALQAFLQSYARKTEAEPVQEALRRSLSESNSAVFQEALGLGAAEEMGTTLVAVAIKEDQMHWISAGDSGIFVLRDGELTAVNAPHIYGAELDEQLAQGNITPEQAAAHPEREALTSFLGLERVSIVDRSVRPFRIREGDTIILASDGLFKTLTTEEIVSSADADPQTMCEALLKRTLDAKRPYQDNVTIVAIHAAKDRPSVVTPPTPATVRNSGAHAVSDTQPLPRGRRRSWLAAVMMVIALCVVAGYIFFMFFRGGANPDPAVKSAPVKNLTPARDGDAFEPAAIPPVDRLPGAQPQNPPETPRQESQPVEGKPAEPKKGDGANKPAPEGQC